MVRKKLTKFLVIAVVLVVSIITVYALNVEDPLDVIHVVKTGESDHGSYDLSAHNTELEQATSGYLGRIELSSDPGYYVKSLSVKYDGNDLALGFEAGAEQGNFFREYPFNSNESLYEFIIPNDATTEKKVEITVEYARKAEIDIYYAAYEGNVYDDEHLYDIDNYGDEHLLVEGYVNGDLVLPNDVISNGSVLKFQFKNAGDYEYYKSTATNKDGDYWIWADGRIRNDEEKRDIELVATNINACVDEEQFCYVVVAKDFSKLSKGYLKLGVDNINIYTPNYIGFSVKADVDNFDDLLFETGGSSISFNEDNLEAEIQLFYGTKRLELTKAVPEPIEKTGLVDETVGVRDFDDVTGSGYGYNVTYNAGKATVAIDSYYQDELVLELTVSKDSQNLLNNNKIRITLHRFAFAGNGGQLLEVDALGRNCREEYNGNTCDEGVYYSTQYRGVYSAFYVKENEAMGSLDYSYRINNIDGNNIVLDDEHDREVYARNKDFNPHAVALFYNAYDEIVETKDFDLNTDVKVEGFIHKDSLQELYAGYNFNKSVTHNYIYFDIRNVVPVKYVDYFDQHINGSIMHDLVLIGKNEAQEKGIEKIALFLVNGDIEEDSIPSLTYGVGEGRVMYIYGGGE